MSEIQEYRNRLAGEIRRARALVRGQNLLASLPERIRTLGLRWCADNVPCVDQRKAVERSVDFPVMYRSLNPSSEYVLAKNGPHRVRKRRTGCVADRKRAKEQGR